MQYSGTCISKKSKSVLQITIQSDRKKEKVEMFLMPWKLQLETVSKLLLIFSLAIMQWFGEIAMVVKQKYNILLKRKTVPVKHICSVKENDFDFYGKPELRKVVPHFMISTGYILFCGNNFFKMCHQPEQIRSDKSIMPHFGSVMSHLAFTVRFSRSSIHKIYVSEKLQTCSIKYRISNNPSFHN